MSVSVKKNVINLGFKVLLQLAPGLLSSIGMGGYQSFPSCSKSFSGMWRAYPRMMNFIDGQFSLYFPFFKLWG